MPAQFHDGFDINDECYSISAVEHPEDLFDCARYNLMPKMKDKGCKRGYTVVFRLSDDQQLIMDRLYTNNRGNPAPSINGVIPTPLKNPAGDLFYRNINLPITYTGGIVVTTEIISSVVANAGFQPPINFKTVLELIFEEGICIKQDDLSLLAKIRRLEKKIADRKNGQNGISINKKKLLKVAAKTAVFGYESEMGMDEETIRECYDLSYRSKYDMYFYDK
jgi:hypothetical protein